MSAVIWIVAAAVYLLFIGWYSNWRGKVRPDEIEAFLSRAKAHGADQHNDLGTLRAFLEQDDGREFFMLNLVKIAPGDIPDPDDGAPVSGRKVMARYTGPFMKRLFQHGGHPAMAARPVGGYVDAWNTGANPGWSIVGYMRYRSRRDLMELAGDESFASIHKYKIAATAETFSFPTQPIILTLLSPKIWVGLVLALLAALVQIAVLLAR